MQRRHPTLNRFRGISAPVRYVISVYPGPVPGDPQAIIRPASDDDAGAITALRAATWRAAYDGILDRAVLDRVTLPATVPVSPPPYRRTLVAADGRHQAVVGYASHGPERRVLPEDGAPQTAFPFSAELTAAGAAGKTGELYALYVTPERWSAGVGRGLLETVVTALREAGYERMVLWTLTGNARARRFYQKAGLVPDGATNIITGLGGVEELRYARDL